MSINYIIGKILKKIGFTILPNYKLPENNGNLLQYTTDLLVSQGRIKTIVQIGGYDGEFEDNLKEIIKNTNNNIQIFIIEPQQKCVEKLKSKYKTKKEVTVIPVAISDQLGQAKMFIPRNTDTSPLASLHKMHLNRFNIKEYSEIIVKSITWNALKKTYNIPNPDLIVIDAEGSEQIILKQILNEKRKPLVIYFEHRHMTKAVKEEIRIKFSRWIRVETDQDTLLLKKINV